MANRLDGHICLRATKHEVRAWRAAAAARGLTFSDWLRRSLDAQADADMLRPGPYWQRGPRGKRA